MESKHMPPKSLLIDRKVMIGLMREERPDLSESSLETNYGDLSRFMESMLIAMTKEDFDAALNLAGFAPSPGAALRLVQEIARKRRAAE